MQIVSNRDNLHEMSNPFSGKNKRNIIIDHLLEILLRVLSIKLRTVGRTGTELHVHISV